MNPPYDNGFSYGTSQPSTHRPQQQQPQRQQQQRQPQQQQQRPSDPPLHPRRQYEPYHPHNAPPHQPTVRSDLSNPSDGRYPSRPPQRNAPSDEYGMSANFNNARPFDDLAYYEQGPQWPLSQPPSANAPPNRMRSHGRGQENVAPLPRPQRSDSFNANLPPSRSDSLNAGLPPIRTQSRTVPSNRQLYYGMPPSQAHQGLGQRVAEGHNRPPQRRPVPPPSGSRLPRPAVSDRAPLPPPAMNMDMDVRRGIPPPSARKFPTAYYTPMNPPPFTIKEESDSLRESTKSSGPSHETRELHPLATSSVVQPDLPLQSDIPEYYLERQTSQDPNNGNVSAGVSAIDSEYESAAERKAESNPDDRYISSLSPSPEPGPVRQASVGKKAKPTLKLVKQLPLSDTDETTTDDQNERPPMRAPAGTKRHSSRRKSDRNLTAVGDPEPQPGDLTDPPSDPHANLSSGTGLIDASSSESESEDAPPPPAKDTPPVPAGKSTTRRTMSPADKTVDAHVEEIIKGLERGGALSPVEAAELKKPMAGLSERAGRRRPPPRLDMDMVRDAEARGSLTSLSDLIKRATRLATNLDHGKTASRLGLDWYPQQTLDHLATTGAADEKVTAPPPTKRRSGASLSDILSSFPAPSAPATGAHTRHGKHKFSFSRRHSKPLHSNSSPDPTDPSHPRASRRCCGLPAWAFILILVLLILLIAAAVVVPVVLVVVPRHQHHGSRSLAPSSSSLPSSASCSTQLSCANGGAAVQTSGTPGDCACLCGSGWMGANCTTPLNSCVTVQTNGASQDVGKAIPGILAAGGNFSLSLDQNTVLGLLASANLGCMTENALVTFNGQVAGKRSTPRDGAASPSTDSATSSGGLATTTSIASRTPAAVATARSATSGSASTTTLFVASPTTLSSSEEFTFAGVAVLYVLQQTSDLNAATSAQAALQKYFTGSQLVSATNITLGDGFSADVTVGCLSVNGTEVGRGS